MAKKLILSLLIGFSGVSLAFCQIAISSTTPVSATTSIMSGTIGHTTSGSNRILWATMGHSSSVNSTGCLYNVVPMTLATTTVHQFGSRLNLYYLINPALGTNLLTCTTSGASGIAIGAMSFTGADQTTQPDAVSAATSSGTTSYSQSVTSVSDNSFAVIGLFAQSGAAITGGANTTIASQPEVVAYGTAMAYSTTAKTPAGLFTLNVTSTSQNFSGVMASFKPAQNTINTTPFFRFHKQF